MIANAFYKPCSFRSSVSRTHICNCCRRHRKNRVMPTARKTSPKPPSISHLRPSTNPSRTVKIANKTKATRQTLPVETELYLHATGLLRRATSRLSSPRPKGPSYSRGRDRLSQTAAVQDRDETENDQHADPYPAADVASNEEIKDHHRKSSTHERCDNDAEYLTTWF